MDSASNPLSDQFNLHYRDNCVALMAVFGPVLDSNPPLDGTRIKSLQISQICFEGKVRMMGVQVRV
jgi:hypothetical protein